MNIYHKILLCRNICPKCKVGGMLNNDLVVCTKLLCDLCGTVYTKNTYFNSFMEIGVYPVYINKDKVRITKIKKIRDEMAHRLDR